ncbi:hypothetical protein XFF6970_880007 [Xanthomonas citri pv. fuscans]|nr:hypothetical protein XFF6970_880007 [Xanthomonas citri pv. fuscans]
MRLVCSDTFNNVWIKFTGKRQNPITNSKLEQICFKNYNSIYTDSIEASQDSFMSGE